MPEEQTLKRAKQDLREGKSPSTAAGEFVHEEIKHVRVGKHGARSPQQAIAIGLSKARRAGIPLPPPKRGKVKEETRKRAVSDYQKGQAGADNKPSQQSSQARREVLAREPHSSASRESLSKQSRTAAQGRSSEDRHRSAQRAVQTKGKEGLRQEAKEAARKRAIKGKSR
ncbi:MAG: DUF6496 domain-containing protein [Terracidiphilus sp.]|jgi:hypothetical protein